MITGAAPLVVRDSWESILRRYGEPLRRNRARCPIHGGDSPYSLSVSESKSLFHCFVCGASGDKIDFIRQTEKCSFREALRRLGLEPGRPPAPDPAAERKRRVRVGLAAWTRRVGREVREEYYNRARIELYARQRLRRDPDDVIGWGLLWVAYDGLPLTAVEGIHDLLIGRPWEQLAAFRIFERVAA